MLREYFVTNNICCVTYRSNKLLSATHCAGAPAITRDGHFITYYIAHKWTFTTLQR